MRMIELEVYGERGEAREAASTWTVLLSYEAYREAVLDLLKLLSRWWLETKIETRFIQLFFLCYFS